MPEGRANTSVIMSLLLRMSLWQRAFSLTRRLTKKLVGKSSRQRRVDDCLHCLRIKSKKLCYVRVVIRTRGPLLWQASMMFPRCCAYNLGSA